MSYMLSHNTNYLPLKKNLSNRNNQQIIPGWSYWLHIIFSFLESWN